MQHLEPKFRAYSITVSKDLLSGLLIEFYDTLSMHLTFECKYG